MLIEENLRRRQLLPSESFKAVKRLYELRGLDGAGRPKNGENPATVAELSSELGKSERTVARMRTLADLIPSLSAMLDARTRTLWQAIQKIQAELEQLKAAQQRRRYSTWQHFG